MSIAAVYDMRHATDANNCCDLPNLLSHVRDTNSTTQQYDNAPSGCHLDSRFIGSAGREPRFHARVIQVTNHDTLHCVDLPDPCVTLVRLDPAPRLSCSPPRADPKIPAQGTGTQGVILGKRRFGIASGVWLEQQSAELAYWCGIS